MNRITLNTAFWRKLSIPNCFLFFLTLIGLVGCAKILVTTPPSIRTAMDRAETLRLQAEQRVGLLKQANGQGTVDVGDFQTAQAKYGSARESFSVWIDQLQDDLVSGKPVGVSEDYRQLVDNAVDQSKQFNSYVDQILQVAPRGASAEDFKAFAEAGKELIKTIKEIDRQKRQELSLKLENLRWQPFEAV